MTTFLLWNVQNKQLDGHIIRLVEQHSPDVLLLVEHANPDDTLMSQLNRLGTFQRVSSSDRFGVFVRFDTKLMKRISPPVANDQVDYWEIGISKRNQMLLVLVHGLDIINNSESKRSLFFARIVSDIKLIESSLGHKNTIVVGDFNANPFDSAVGGAEGLHAIRLKDVGGKTTRSVLKRDYEFFCNPMWSCFRGWEKAPGGTFYFNRSDVHEIFWHLLDQVVLRPQAIHMFSERNLRVLTEAGSVSLLTSHGLPDTKKASDHLPVLFKINLNAKVKK